MNPEDFDSHLGWWKTANLLGIDAARQEIQSFIRGHPNLSSYWKSILHFRVGQILAIQNKPESLLWFQRGFLGNSEWDSYVSATIHFVSREPNGLSLDLKDLYAMGLTDNNKTIQRIKKLQWLMSIGVFEYRWFIQPLRVVNWSKAKDPLSGPLTSDG